MDMTLRWYGPGYDSVTLKQISVLSITITNWKADVHIIVIKSGMNIF